MLVYVIESSHAAWPDLDVTGLDEGWEPLAHFMYFLKLENIDIVCVLLQNSGTRAAWSSRWAPQLSRKASITSVFVGRTAKKGNLYTNTVPLLPPDVWCQDCEEVKLFCSRNLYFEHRSSSAKPSYREGSISQRGLHRCMWPNRTKQGWTVMWRLKVE